MSNKTGLTISIATGLLIVYVTMATLTSFFVLIFLLFMATSASLFCMVYCILIDTANPSSKTFDEYFYEDSNTRHKLIDS